MKLTLKTKKVWNQWLSKWISIIETTDGKVSFSSHRKPKGNQNKAKGFMLAEVVVGMALVATMIVSLMAGLLFCQTLNRLSRDSIQATQILVSKTEAIRLVRWDQVLEMQLNPVQFIQNEGGIDYRGTVSVGPSEVSSSYSNDLRKVSVYLSWETGNVRRHLAFQTLVSKYGLQSYLY